MMTRQRPVSELLVLPGNLGIVELNSGEAHDNRIVLLVEHADLMEEALSAASDGAGPDGSSVNDMDSQQVLSRNVQAVQGFLVDEVTSRAKVD